MSEIQRVGKESQLRKSLIVLVSIFRGRLKSLMDANLSCLPTYVAVFQSVLKRVLVLYYSIMGRAINFWGDRDWRTLVYMPSDVIEEGS